MRRYAALAMIISLVALVALVLASEAWAPAPRGSIQQVGLVLKKLDVSQPPTYPNEFFTPPPAPGEKGGREKLTDDVADALRIMGDPAATGGVWCPSINDILMLAVGTVTYFDITYVSNPALDDFKKDWLKVQQLAGC